MPYEKESGKWRHPGGYCGQCDGTGVVLTKEINPEKNSQSTLFAWRCSCHIGEDRNLKFPRYGSR